MFFPNSKLFQLTIFEFLEYQSTYIKLTFNPSTLLTLSVSATEFNVSVCLPLHEYSCYSIIDRPGVNMAMHMERGLLSEWDH